MKTLSKRLFFFMLGSISILPWQSSLALDFDPNYIISDSELQDVQSMNRADIQAFLENQHSFLSSYRTLDASSTEQLASHIIYNAAHDYAINPKYLLVKLQKEQSLITDPDPSQRQLDWATGYAVCDSCSTLDPSLQKFKGFGVQVDKAAGIMRWYFDNLYNYNWIKKANSTYTIDNTQIVPANLATAFLYTYTPHIHGNKNFWTLWQTWFDQVYPDGTLLKSVDSKTIYVLTQGKKRPFATMAALVSRYNTNQILTVPVSELARYGDGPAISMPNYSILKTTNGKYYLLDYDIARPFESEAVVRAMGYNPQEILDITDSDLAGYTIGSTITSDTTAPAGKLVRLKETKQIYFLKDGQFHALPDEQMAAINHPGMPITTVTASDLSAYTDGAVESFKDGTLIGIKNGHDIYVIDAGKKRHITSVEVFVGLGYTWQNIIWVNELTASLHPDGAPIYLRPTVNIASLSGEINNDKTADVAQIDTATGQNTDTTTTDIYLGDKFSTDVPTYLVADANSAEILAGKNIDTLRPAASLTKVMTAYQLLLDGLSLDRSTVYNPDTMSADTIFRLTRGEQVLNEHLMEAMLVSSLNTPSRILASTLDISEKQFIAHMNTTAKSLGLSSTTFTDTSGLDLGNQTTAREYLKLYLRATQNSTVKRIMSMNSYEYDELHDVDGKPHHIDNHTNTLVAKKNLPFSIITSKTGYLPESGNHLVMHIQRLSDKKQFIVMTMGNNNKANKFDAPEQLARWAVANL